MVDLNGLWRRVLAALLLCSTAGLVSPAHGAALAMITDLQGEAASKDNGPPRALRILAELEAGTVVRLGPGATLVALYLETGDEFVLKGPATIIFAPDSPEVQEGAKPQRRTLALGKDGRAIRIRPVGVAQGGMVMRSVRPDVGVAALEPRRTTTMDLRPVFRWSGPLPDLAYRFELRDDAGTTLRDAEVRGTSIALPAGEPLRPGATYVWRVSTTTPDGRKHSDSAEFAIAPAELRAEAEALRPSHSAPLSSRIAYAAWLDQMDLRDEARKYWREASQQRPDDPVLRRLAAQ